MPANIIMYAHALDAVAFVYVSNSPEAETLLKGSPHGYWQDGTRYTTLEESEWLLADIDSAALTVRVYP
jgi:hypothetical protein